MVVGCPRDADLSTGGGGSRERFQGLTLHGTGSTSTFTTGANTFTSKSALMLGVQNAEPRDPRPRGSPRSRIAYRLPTSAGCGDCAISIGTFLGSTPS